jgi:hypothetical protein
LPASGKKDRFYIGYDGGLYYKHMSYMTKVSQGDLERILLASLEAQNQEEAHGS